MYEKSDLELRAFFNTRGKRYRELNMKEKMTSTPEEELLEILASDGMLMKRPLTTDGKNVTVGFKEAEFESHWK